MRDEHAICTALDIAVRDRALGFFFEALQGLSQADPRAELAALNATLRKHGVPQLAFGALPHVRVPVGAMFLRRAELAVLGLHRHFLSEASYTCEGIESLLLVPDSRCRDEAECIYYSGCGTQSAQLTASRRALTANAERGRPVRVLRMADAATAALTLRTAGETAGKRRREVFRYDGVYTVQRLTAEEAVAEGHAADEDDASEAPSFVLTRMPGQSALPAGIGNGKSRKRGRVEMEHPAGLSLLGLAAGEGASAMLPLPAEELCTGGTGLSVQEALRRLQAARADLLAELSPADAYLLAKRAAINQVRLRSALELIHTDAGASTAGGGAPKRRAFAAWPVRKKLLSSHQ